MYPNESQFPNVCQSIAGKSVANFYAAFPWDAADLFSPTVVAHWGGKARTFVTRTHRYLVPDLLVDSINRVWIVNGNELQAYDSNGICREQCQIAKKVRGLSVGPGENDTYWVLHTPNRLTRIHKSKSRTRILSRKGDLGVLAVDAKGRVWSGGNREGIVYREDGGTGKLVVTNGNAIHPVDLPRGTRSITSLLCSATGRIYIATVKGQIFSGDVDELATGSKRPTLMNSSSAPEYIHKIADDSNNGFFAIGYSHLSHWRKNAWRHKRIVYRGKPIAVRSICMMRDGIVLGTNDGVLIQKPMRKLPRIESSWFDP